MEKINILIRTCGRKELFLRCLQSVTDQNYPNLRVIVSIDRDIDYVPDWCESIRVYPSAPGPYFYDAYSNDLKSMVSEGWFMFLDDDDTLAPDCLNKLQLNAPAILVQINHMGRIIPTKLSTDLGSVGMPSLVLHHSLKGLYDFAPKNQLDHNDVSWINAVKSNVSLSWQPIVLAVIDRKGGR